MSTVKTVAIFAVIIGCFSMLYPKFLHPVVLKIIGQQPKPTQEKTDVPPGRNLPSGMHPELGRQPNMARGADMRQHMRPGPHPGMRAAADMARQQTQHGSGRGMMGIVLPMYAVGIVLYLIYTLMKVFSKKDKESNDAWEAPNPNPLANIPENLTSQDVKNLFGKDKKKDLETLLMKADEKSISEKEMHELQSRLEETEAQMTQILKAMQLVQKATDIVPDTRQRAPLSKQTSSEKPQTKTDSSPDMDSYEIVNKSGQKTPTESGNGATSESAGTPESVETIGPEGSMENKTESSEKNETSSGKEAGDRVHDGKEEQEVTDKVHAGKIEEEVGEEEKKEKEVLLRSGDDETNVDGNVRHRNVPSSEPH